MRVQLAQKKGEEKKKRRIIIGRERGKLMFVGFPCLGIIYPGWGLNYPIPFHSDLKPANYPAFLAGGQVPKPRPPNVKRAKHRRQMTRDLGQLRAQNVRSTGNQQRGATVAPLPFAVNSLVFVTVRHNL